MKLLVTHEIHAVEVDGKYYNPGIIDYNALNNYRFACEEIVVVLRCKKGVKVEKNYLRIDGPGINVHPVPDLNFNSPFKALFRLPAIFLGINRAIKSADKYMVRLPGPTGALTSIILKINRKKYGVELAGDPEGILRLGNNVVKFQWFYSIFNGFIYRNLIKNACAVGYRSNFLKKMYPNKSQNNEFVFSGVQITNELISSPKPVEWFEREPFRIIFVGRMSREKGLMELLYAFDSLRKKYSKTMELHFVGDGEFLETIKNETIKLGIQDNVVFYGRIPWGKELFEKLDLAHCFVIPTYSEGMPRSLLEAMARGLPCFGSDIDVIKEVLDDDLVFKVRSYDAIEKCLAPYIIEPNKLSEVSARCFMLIKKHFPEELKNAKTKFWAKVFN